MVDKVLMERLLGLQRRVQCVQALLCGQDGPVGDALQLERLLWLHRVRALVPAAVGTALVPAAVSAAPHIAASDATTTLPTASRPDGSTIGHPHRLPQPLANGLAICSINHSGPGHPSTSAASNHTRVFAALQHDHLRHLRGLSHSRAEARAADCDHGGP